SLDIGLMQINTQHEPELKRYGITRHHLTADPCMNIYTGAYYLAIAFRHWGVNWDAVGAYNAGFAKNAKQDKRRKHYARKIYATYHAIKAQKKAAN
ncbi:transglycosylase SLT domain-containing protein, partial [Salmonella enterica subsp. enterica serovar Braenderup]